MSTGKADWYSDPCGVSELRYFDGSAWTNHVISGGEQSVDEVAISDLELPSPQPLDQLPPPPVAPLTASASVGDQPPPPGPSTVRFDVQDVPAPPVIEIGPATSRTQQPSSTKVLWEGQSETLSAKASGGRLTKARYRVTEDAIHFEAGILSTRAEVIPLWTVLDVDLHQSMTQKARGVGDVRVRLEQDAAKFGQVVINMESIRDPREVRDLITRHANDLRQQFAHREHQLEVEKLTASSGSVNVGMPMHTIAPATPVPAPNRESDDRQALIDHLRQLGELRDLGVLTEEEFQAQKASLLA